MRRETGALSRHAQTLAWCVCVHKGCGARGRRRAEQYLFVEAALRVYAGRVMYEDRVGYALS